MKRIAALLGAALLLSACGAKPAPAVPSAQPTTSITVPNAAPTAPAPTEKPVRETVPPINTSPAEPPLPLDLEPELREFFDISQPEDYMETAFGSHYGFPQDYLYGCSVWCAVTDRQVQASASSYLPQMGQFTYLPGNAIDGSRDTVWVEGAEDYGIGEYIDITHTYNQDAGSSDRVFDFQTICIVNGYAQNQQKWSANSRVKELKLYVNDVYQTRLNLQDTVTPQYFDITPLHLSALAGEETRFRFEIADIYPGDLYKDTCITGIEFEFWTPNH